jgi:hypothetical protein
MALRFRRALAPHAHVDLAFLHVAHEFDELEAAEAAPGEGRKLRRDGVVDPSEGLRLQRHLRVVEPCVATRLRQDGSRQLVAELVKELAAKHLDRHMAVHQRARAADGQPIAHDLQRAVRASGE